MFRLYRSKVKCDLNSRIYNYLKHTRYTGKSVAEIMAMVDKNDLELEGNLSTILQPVRGTNQYWYKVNGELKCMIRECGSPTFFLTLTCGGAPHYYIVLWIRDSPVLGRDSPEKVLSFIQERITCHIPDSKTSSDLHALVTKY